MPESELTHQPLDDPFEEAQKQAAELRQEEPQVEHASVTPIRDGIKIGVPPQAVELTPFEHHVPSGIGPNHTLNEHASEWTEEALIRAIERYDDMLKSPHNTIRKREIEEAKLPFEQRLAKLQRKNRHLHS